MVGPLVVIGNVCLSQCKSNYYTTTVDRGFDPQSGQTKDYIVGICCFTALRRKSKDWFTRNQDNVSRVGRHAYPRTVVSVSYHYKNPTKRVGLVQSGPRHHLIEN